MESDTIKIEILPDGSLKATTDEISAANHFSAEELITAIERRAGGATDVRARDPHAHVHQHEHGHDHLKAGH